MEINLMQNHGCFCINFPFCSLSLALPTPCYLSYLGTSLPLHGTEIKGKKNEGKRKKSKYLQVYETISIFVSRLN
ncbi:MAG: hypothetical protein IJ928_04240 [Prevotella sp.]|nr:hypothetical protein [Prevotella sp.]